MASNYNSRTRAAEVMVHGDTYTVVRSRETLDDLWRGEAMLQPQALWAESDE
jgi:diaminopimelate decarboxylase